MRFRQAARTVVVALLLGLALSACASEAATEEAGGSDIATVEPIAGTGVARVTLSEEAAHRLDIHTASVRTSNGHTTIPYAAVLYDPAGDTWTFTNPEPLVFVRAPIDVISISGERALLSSGPAPGTDVVTVGAAELLGTEYEVGGE